MPAAAAADTLIGSLAVTISYIHTAQNLCTDQQHAVLRQRFVIVIKPVLRYCQMLQQLLDCVSKCC